jgi:hypothetical protein
MKKEIYIAMAMGVIGFGLTGGISSAGVFLLLCSAFMVLVVMV